MYGSPELPPRGCSSMFERSLQPPSEREAPARRTTIHLHPSRWSPPLGGGLGGVVERPGAPSWRGLRAAAPAAAAATARLAPSTHRAPTAPAASSTAPAASAR